jgi:hypothetical protein
VQKRVKTCKNVHLKYSFIKKSAKKCKIVQKCAKTCISNIFGPNSKTCTCEVRAAWGRVSRGFTVWQNLDQIIIKIWIKFGYSWFFQLQIFWRQSVDPNLIQILSKFYLVTVWIWSGYDWDKVWIIGHGRASGERNWNQPTHKS